MTAITFVLFVATIVVIVAGYFLAEWLFARMGVPERPKMLLLIVIGVIGAVIIFAFAYRILTSLTLYT